MTDLTLPHEIFENRKFEGVVLDPPEFKPGYWCGAGKLWIDGDDYWLTSRPRAGADRRGYAAEIYRSGNGRDFALVKSLSKDEVSRMAGENIQSIENQQLLKDPSTANWHLYLSLDVYRENAAGDAERVYESKWETYLLTARDPRGPWKGMGFVLRSDQDCDGAEARDSTIDIFHKDYVALYKARPEGGSKVNMALATSEDGITWKKHGVLRIDGKPQPDFFLLNGSIISTRGSPLFVGIQTTDVVNGAALSRKFASYTIDFDRIQLGKVFLEDWTPGSIYEDPSYPIHTYSTLALDESAGRWMMMVEAVDPTTGLEPGLNLEVDRVLLYTSKAGSKGSQIGKALRD